MTLILETSTGEIPLTGYSELETATLVMTILANRDWARLCSNDRKYSTQWTVLERNEKGLPVQIASSEFDGEMEVIRCG